MTDGDGRSLGEVFAVAFLRSLSGAQKRRLSEIVLGSGTLSMVDLRDMPALQGLVSAPVGEKPLLSDDVRVLLSGLLAQDGTELAPPIWASVEENPFMAIIKGAEVAAKLSADIPETVVTENLQVGLFKTVLALKSGDLARADALMTVLSEHFDIPILENCGSDHAPELSCVLFMKAIYSDEEISDRATERLFGILSGLPNDAALLRAILYNVALDVFLRQQRMSEAEEAAYRALFHYDAAGERGVAFYVHLYLVVIGMWRGDLGTTEKQIREARAAFSAFEGATQNDDLLLRSFEMIVAYETGDADGFIRHLMRDEDTIPFGELWPSMAGPIIRFGRRALANKVTPAAALSWVRRWRVRQRRSLRFDKLISVQEALALQDLGRWQEADEILGGVLTSEGLEIQIARFASGLDRNPKSAALVGQIIDYLSRPELSVRQKLVLRLMATESALARGGEREAARHLNAAIQDADPELFPSVWSEQRHRVARILNKRDLRTELRRFPKLKRQIQALAKVDAPEKPAALTRQEFRVLQLLAEAQSNKAIGSRLGVALPTVKFHVANLCRKTNADNRRAVVQAAIDRGWLAES